MSHKFSIFPLLIWLFVNAGQSSGRIVLRLRSDSQCPMAGYYRDETDCHKFYRCAEHSTEILGQYVISKVEFHCPEGTIYDETLSSCNHISFVRDIPGGCNASSSPSSSVMMPSMESTVSSTENPTVPPNSSQPSQPPSFPIPPSNLPQLPIMPGDQQNPQMPPELPIIPGGNPDNQFPLPVLPPPGNEGEQLPPMIPGFPMPGTDGQPPSIPGLPIPGTDGQPSIPGSPIMEEQNQFPQIMPPAISIPVMQGEQQQQQQQSFPNIYIPGQTLPNKFPFNFNMFSGNFQHPTISVPTLPGISSIPGNNLFNQQQGTNVQNPRDQNSILSQGISNSQIALPVSVQNNNEMMGEATSASWINPPKIIENKNQPSNIKNQLNNEENSGWVVPNNFPSLYSLIGGRTPFLLSGQQVSGIPRTQTYILI